MEVAITSLPCSPGPAAGRGAPSAPGGDEESAPLLPGGQKAGGAAPGGPAAGPAGPAGPAAGATPAAGRVLARIASLAWPLVLANFFGHSITVVSAIAVGHLDDPTILSSVVLAGSVFNVAGLSIVMGLSAGLDTIAGQAFGARNYKMLGTVLQRAVLICWVACLPILLLFYNIHAILLALGQAAPIASGTAQYLRISGPTLLLYALSTSLNRYLTSQQVVAPGMVCAAITSVLCPLYNWLLVHWLNYGLKGAAWAYMLSISTNAVLLLGYTSWRHVRMQRQGDPACTWPGFTRSAFKGWRTYLKYGLPAAAMMCAEWWLFELVILLAGALANPELSVAVMGIMFQIISVSYMLPMAFGSSVNTCISNALGAGDGALARRAASIGIGIAAITQSSLALGMFSLRHRLVSAFSPTPAIVSLGASVVPAVAFACIGDGGNATLGGVLRACGRQTWGASLNLFSYWCVGLPLTLLLGFKLHWGVEGFWVGLGAGSALQALCQLVVVVRLDWGAEVQRAQSLVGDHAPEGSHLLPATCAGVAWDRGEDEGAVHQQFSTKSALS